jgi:hypothetical protein
MTEATAAAKSGSGIEKSRTTDGPVVLTYELADKHLTASLIDASDGSQRGDARTMDLDDHTPEQIGLTVPMLWELLDMAKVKPGTVVVLGDVRTETVSPILELALGVPVIAPGAPTSKKSAAAKSTTPKSGTALGSAGAQTANGRTRPVPAKLGGSGSRPAAAAKPNIAAAAKPKTAAAASTKPSASPKPSDADTADASAIDTDAVATPSTKAKTAPAATAAAAGGAAGAVALTMQNSAKVAATPASVVDDPPTEEIAVVTSSGPGRAYAESDVTAPVPFAAPAPPVSGTAAATASESSGGRGRRGLVVAAVATALVVAGGIGAALGFTNDAPAPSPRQNPSAVTQDATPRSAESPSTVPSAAVPPPTAPASAAVPAPAAPPVVPAAPDASAGTSGYDNSAPPAWTPSRVPASAAPAVPAPQSSATYIPPPQFTVPVPVPDPNNPNATPQELQDKAWADHWERTREYLEQQEQLGG